MPSTMERKDRIKELGTALERKNREIADLEAHWSIDDATGDVHVDEANFTAYRKAVTEGEQIEQMIMLSEKAAGLGEFGRTPARGALNVAALDAVERSTPTTWAKSLWDLFKETDSWKELAETGFKGHPRANGSFEVALSGMEVKDIYSSMAGDIPINALGTPENLGLTRRTIRPGRVRDLFPKTTTTANILYGIREVGFLNRARVVSERAGADGISAPTGAPTDTFGLKPNSELSIVPVVYQIATIAHIMYAHRNTLADEPRMRDLIDVDLVDGVKLVEDFQLLFGDGVGDNLLGLCNTPGTQSYVGDIADPHTAQIRRAITRSILAHFIPTGLVLNPLNWERIELEKDDTGAYRLVMNVSVGAQKRLWRLDVVDTVAMVENRFLLGSFGQGAKVYDREQVNIAISTENRDMFEKNAVTLRGEERLGLVVDRPESFVYGTLTGNNL